MGGNAIIAGWSADPIKNNTNINDLIKDLRSFMSSLYDFLGIRLFPSGSTENMMSKFRLPPSIKPFFGDVDFMFDSEMTESLTSALEKMLYKEQPTCGLKLLGIQKTDQIITIWWWNEQYIQIDFEPAEFIGGSPTEWARFSHNSSIDDMRYGVKGVFHKLLLRALNAPDVKSVLIKDKTGEKFKEIKSAEYALSVSGLRRKLYPVMAEDEYGLHHLWIDGKPVYHEFNKKEWIRDLDIIFAFYFGKKKDLSVNVNKMKDFRGLADLISITRDNQECMAIVNGFANTLWGKGAQKLYRNDLKRDEAEKLKAFHLLADALKVPTIPWEHMTDIYYGRETEEYQTL